MTTVVRSAVWVAVWGAVTIHATVVHADEMELQPHVLAGVMLTEHGAQGSLIAGLEYGVTDWLNVGAQADCAVGSDLAIPDTPVDAGAGTLYYDAVQCSSLATARFGHGARIVPSLGVGFGVGWASRTNQQVIRDSDNVLLAELAENSTGSAILHLDASLLLRLNDHHGLLATVAARRQLGPDGSFLGLALLGWSGFWFL